MMVLEQRSYSGHAFRPRPLIEELPAQKTLIVATSWGDPDHAQWVVDLIKEHLQLAGNPDATRVGAYVPELSESGNLIRAAALFANEQLHLKENSKEYKAAVEIAIVTFEKQVLSWVQMGNPHLVLQTPQGMQPLVAQPDWASQLQQDTPLVCRALGLDRVCYPNCGSHRLQKNEKLILISRSTVPSRFYTLENPDLVQCSSALVSDHEEAPFWLGVVSL